ncbi:MBL fold metallo-hydrolase [Chitinibacter bivalviorum]|uniref:MBL fold metallo-hydrolase n=1 Tax=Chitinibacter bivalviorum TaxID=2739434 RepID=A0A7H9BJL9_9NEIS|nr:MBL fold metallo-hydrolase [Chitinibacter bivalviorum]QLG88860.1 MBL fold metallo-hydrolase [Chitinibacter bivalviorum]
MKKAQLIASTSEHRWYAISRDPARPHHLIDTNEYVVTTGDDSILCDPGGSEVFPAVFAALSEVIDPRTVQRIFSSHQDPDVISSLGLWNDFNPKIRCHVSGLWGSFIPHFGCSEDTLVSIPDEGGIITLGKAELQFIPAHYLHSSGNFHLYDPECKLLFTGDIGAALLPNHDCNLYVEDFDTHIRYAEGFHKRWMGSNTAKQKWINRVRELDIDLMCPQHGAIYRGDDVKRFIDWFDKLQVGIG